MTEDYSLIKNEIFKTFFLMVYFSTNYILLEIGNMTILYFFGRLGHIKYESISFEITHFKATGSCLIMCKLFFNHTRFSTFHFHLYHEQTISKI